MEINLTQTLLSSINSLFSSLINSIDSSIYLYLDDLLFISSDIVSSTHVKNILGSQSSFGIISICNALLLGFLLYYGFNLLLSHLTFSKVARPPQFIFKLVLCVIAFNSSEFICIYIIKFFQYISLLIRSIGEELFTTNISFAEFVEKLSTIYAPTGDFNLFTFNGLIRSFISIGLINLIISYALRYVIVQVFILMFPFAILSLSIEQFAWIFKAWCRTFFSLMFQQIFVALILLISFSLDISGSTTFSSLLCIGSIYALIKANSFAKEFIGGLTTDINFGISTIKSLILGG